MNISKCSIRESDVPHLRPEWGRGKEDASQKQAKPARLTLLELER